MRYRKIYQKAAANGGWSKRKLDLTTEWGDFYELVKKRLRGDEVVLDTGTAEGNHFLRLAPYIKKGVGVDLEPGMIKLAKQNKKKYKIKNILFRIMDANKLEFPEAVFDVVTNKHSSINFQEVYRILKKGGLFITQQVHETDKLNLKRAFGRGQDFCKKAGKLLAEYKREARRVGFQNIQSRISNIPCYFASRKKLIAFLNKAPTVPDFGQGDDYQILKKFIQKNKTSKGIKSNTSRFLLEMRKG